VQLPSQLGGPKAPRIPAAIFVDTNDTVWVKAPSRELVSRSRGETKFRLRQHVFGPSSNPAFLGEGTMLWLQPPGFRKIGSVVGCCKMAVTVTTRSYPGNRFWKTPVMEASAE
jgi:hypothetical protein